MKRILIAEDDVDIRQALVDLLEGEGYGVTAVGDGEKAIDAWRTAKEPFDLLLLDVMMPEKSGYDVCRTVRAAGSSVAVLMLSAKGAEIDKVVGLELGADDYVTKPFGVRELLARIAAALRRSAPQKTSDLAADDFDFACAAVSVKRYCLQGAKGSEPITDIEMKLMPIEVRENSVLAGKTSASLRLRDEYQALLVAIQRGEDEYIKPDGNETFMPHDTLWVVGNETKLAALCK